MVIEYFGLPGCGKTSHLVKTAVTTQKNIDRGWSKYKAVYSNVYVDYPGIRLIKWEYIGLYDYTDCLILIDEVGLNAHCRSHEQFPKRIAEWFCTHRHDRVDLIFYAQYYNQADKTIREVTERLFFMRRSIIPNCTRITKIPKTIVIPKDTGDIKEGYRMPSFLERLFVSRTFSRRHWYGYFNSWDSYKKRLPAKYELIPGKPDWQDTMINKYLSTPVKKVYNALLTIPQKFAKIKKKRKRS